MNQADKSIAQAHDDAPLVSVIVPNYNYARYLPERMESIFAQTMTDFEVILLDDCSTDDSREVIERYRNHPQVSHIVYNDTNSGSPFAQWKRGIELARGRYVWIAEADDLSDPRFLAATVEPLEHDAKAVVAIAGSTLIDGEGDPLPSSDWDKWGRRRGVATHEGEEYIVHNLFWRAAIYNAGMALFRHAAYSPEVIAPALAMRNAGDWMFWSRLAGQGRVVEVYEKLNYFRRHGTSTTVGGDRTGRIRLEEIDVLRYIADRYPVGDYRRRLRIGQFMRTVIRNRQYTPDTRRAIFERLQEVFGSDALTLGSLANTYRFNRLHKLAATLCPLLLTQRRDRL